MSVMTTFLNTVLLSLVCVFFVIQTCGKLCLVGFINSTVTCIAGDVLTSYLIMWLEIKNLVS